jgi:hypothetical protein
MMDLVKTLHIALFSFMSFYHQVFSYKVFSYKVFNELSPWRWQLELDPCKLRLELGPPTSHTPLLTRSDCRGALPFHLVVGHGQRRRRDTANELSPWS